MMQGGFVVLSSKYNIICVLRYTSIPYMALNSQGGWLPYDMNHINGDRGIF